MVPVLVRRLNGPCRGWLLGDETDLYNLLDAFETVLPRHHQSNRSAVLGRQGLAIESGGQNRQRMHGFIETQPFDIRPIKHASDLVGHATRIEKRLKRDELCR